jgi:hypothetical protein
MKARCDNPAIASHGGRGIKYDPRWKDYSVFLDEMGERPFGKTLERKSVEGHYCKGNCTWASVIDQANNQRRTKMLCSDFENQGPQGSPAEWARYLRSVTGNELWTVKQLKSVLTVLTLDQVLAGLHPNQLSLEELKERAREARKTEDQRRADAAFEKLLAGLP